MCVVARLGGSSRRWDSVEGSTSCHLAVGSTYSRRSTQSCQRSEQGVKQFQERRQPHIGVMKQEKDGVTQHLEAL
ncbi:hypothetical protein T06_16325 [Trichinella sp. T6]|nr:hypothetical protein T06_14155 [Trichinella sp. T6]KRX65485.1 hypothetical protein T06_15128 [Trichinella sp. T6]KRX74091.1 hypothetical protein T06_16325 [Trichinella sp. T6]